MFWHIYIYLRQPQAQLIAATSFVISSNTKSTKPLFFLSTNQSMLPRLLPNLEAAADKTKLLVLIDLCHIFWRFFNNLISKLMLNFLQKNPNNNTWHIYLYIHYELKRLMVCLLPVVELGHLYKVEHAWYRFRGGYDMHTYK